MNQATPDDGLACSITEEIIHCIIATNSVDTFQGVICYGTGVNIERVGGVIKKFELFLERPLHGYFACSLPTFERN